MRKLDSYISLGLTNEYLISARRQRNEHIINGFSRSGGLRSENEKKQKEYLDLEKVVEYVCDGDTDSSWRTRNSFQRLWKKTGGTGGQKKDRTIQITALLRSVWILSQVLETWENMLSFRLQWKIFS